MIPKIPKHPMQPLIRDDQCTIRFSENKIVRYLLEACRSGRRTDLNDLSRMGILLFSRDDWTQFYQLIGYSIDGFAELMADKFSNANFRVSAKSVKDADDLAAAFTKGETK